MAKLSRGAPTGAMSVAKATPALLLLLFMSMWTSVATTARAEIAVPPLHAYVTDLTTTLTPSQIQSLEQELRALEQEKGSQIAVLIVPTTEQEPIEGYGIRVAESWKLGRKGVDDGAILLVAKNDRTVRIEVGRGLEGVIPDVIGKRIIEETIVPHFKVGDFYGGIHDGVDSLMQLVRGEALPEPAQHRAAPGASEGVLPFLIFGAFAAGAFLRRIAGPLVGAGLTGALTGAAAWILFGSLWFAAMLALFAFVFTIGGGIGPGGFGGYRYGGYGGSVGGGGGLSGGGGDFGGGGASGRW